MRRTARKLASLALALIFLLALLPGSVFAATVVASGSCGADGANVTWSLDSAGVMTVSGTGAMADYSWYDRPWQEQRDSIKQLKISSGVTRVGSQTFNSCKSLTSVTLPTSVTAIGVGAFNNSGLISVTIPASVTSIEVEAFRNCESLTQFIVNAGNTVYTAVDGVLFSKDKAILLVYPAGKEGASYVVPSSATAIGPVSFVSCKLESITIPASVNVIDYSSFIFCGNLKEFKIDSGNTNFTAVSGILFSRDKKTLLAYPAGKTAASYTVPSGVAAVGLYAFHYAKNLQSIKLPDSVMSIGSGAFMYCSSLNSMVIPKGTTRISDSSYYGCSALTSVTIPASVTQIDANTFNYCTALADVYYGAGKAAWASVSIGTGNEALASANMHYDSDGPAGALAISSVTADKTAASMGDTVTWTASATGGTGALQYCFYVYKNGTVVHKGAYSTAKTFSYVPTAAGSYTAKAFVKDASDSTSKTSGATTVTAGGSGGALTVSSIKADKTTANVGDTITWTGAATGGSGTLQYCFYVYKDGKNVYKGAYGSTKTVSYTAAEAGAYTAKVFVKDASGASVSLLSGKTTVGSAAALTVSSIKADKTTANVGDTITWTGAATGGSGTLQYCFYVYKDGKNVYKGAYGSAKTVSYTAAEAGAYTAKVFVKDASGSVSLLSGATTVTAAAEPLAVSSITANRTTAEAGDDVVWTATATGGRGSLKYCFYVYKEGRIAEKGTYGSENTYTYTAEAAGSYTAKVFVKDDSASPVTLTSAEIAVTAAAEPLTVSSIKADKTAAGTGDTITWTASAAGGSGTLQYCFYVYKDGKIAEKGTYGSAKSYIFTAEEAGSYRAKVFVKDASGTPVTMQSEVVVVTEASEPIAVSSLKANKTAADVGDTITWTATATGGSGTLQYCFYVYNNGTVVKKGAYSAAKTFSYTPTAEGSYSAKVFVKDGAGGSKTLAGGSVAVTAAVSSYIFVFQGNGGNKLSPSGYEYLNGSAAPYYYVYIDGERTKAFLAEDPVWFEEFPFGFYEYTWEDGVYQISEVINWCSDTLSRRGIHNGKLYAPYADGVEISARIVDVSGDTKTPIISVDRLEELLDEGFTVTIQYAYKEVSDQYIPTGVIYVTDVVAP